MTGHVIRVENLKHGDRKPVARAVVLIKTLIDDEATIYDIDLALTEAVANVATHAYPGEESGPLEINIRTDPGRLVQIDVRDWGRLWNHDCLTNTLPTSDCEHGRGIPLMTRLCDRVEFRRDENSNIITLIKNVPPGAWHR